MSSSSSASSSASPEPPSKSKREEKNAEHSDNSDSSSSDSESEEEAVDDDVPALFHAEKYSHSLFFLRTNSFSFTGDDFTGRPAASIVEESSGGKTHSKTALKILSNLTLLRSSWAICLLKQLKTAYVSCSMHIGGNLVRKRRTIQRKMTMKSRKTIGYGKFVWVPSNTAGCAKGTSDILSYSS